MNLSPGQSVIVVDTTGKPAGTGVIQEWHPETRQYTVLFQYPNKTEPEPIIVPQERVLSPRN
ncbi:MAG TPA: hypothetical protein VHE54_14950 [Puia sp.]|nr:hypothetical protein [Puia sp.]